MSESEKHDLISIICLLSKNINLCTPQVDKAISYYNDYLSTDRLYYSTELFLTRCTHYMAIMYLHKKYNYKINEEFINRKFCTYIPQTTELTWLLHYMFISNDYSEQMIRNQLRILFKKSRISHSEWQEITTDVLYLQSAPESVLLDIFDSEYQRKTLVVGNNNG